MVTKPGQLNDIFTATRLVGILGNGHCFLKMTSTFDDTHHDWAACGYINTAAMLSEMKTFYRKVLFAYSFIYCFVQVCIMLFNRRNLARVNVYYKSVTEEIISQEPRYKVRMDCHTYCGHPIYAPEIYLLPRGREFNY